jgi:hypothetical protein
LLEAGPLGGKAPINVGARAAFDLTDWNNNGTIDLVAGGQDGKVRLLLKHGTAVSPDFASPIFVQGGAGDLTAPTGRASVAVADLA